MISLKKTRLLARVLMFTLSCGANGAKALTEGGYTYTAENGGATITRFDKSYLGHLDITDRLGGYPVTKIGPCAFYACIGLACVRIPPTVTEVGTASFNNCSALTNIFFSPGLRNISKSAFGVCSALKAVTIPDGVTNIGNFAFSGNTNLVEVTLPASVCSIGRSAFCLGLNLERITVADDNPAFRSVDGVLFDRRGTLLVQYPRCRPGQSYNIPESVSAIEEHAFFRCHLTNVTFPKSLKRIGTIAFFNSDLVSVELPAGIESVGDYAFQSCCDLVSVSVPSSVRDIGFRAFAFCANLSNVTLQEGVTSIGHTSFKRCTALTDIVVPASVALIKKSAFDGCCGLKNIYFEGQPPSHQSPSFADVSATAYYLPGKPGWTGLWAGLPTACVVPGSPDVTSTFFDGADHVHAAALVSAIRKRLGGSGPEADRRMAETFEKADLMGLFASDLTADNITKLATEISIASIGFTDDDGVVLTVTCRNGITSAEVAIKRLLRDPSAREVRVEIMDSLGAGRSAVHLIPTFSQSGDTASALFRPPPAPAQFYRVSVRRK